jgi:hypothetical protein
MSDESAALVEGAEPAVVASDEGQVAGPEDETEGQEADENETDPDGPGEEEPVEELEFDYGGNKFRVPKGALPEDVAAKFDQFLKGSHADYTRKSQDVAQRAKQLEAREGAVEKLTKLSGETLNTYSRGLQIKSEIEQLSKIDVNALWQSDPDQARRVSDAMAQRQAEFQRVVATVAQQEQGYVQAHEAEIARRADEGRQLMERRVKGFSQKVPEVIDYVVKEYGLSREEAETWPLNPKTAEMAYKAMMFDRMQARAGKPAAKPQVKPVTPMKGKGGSEPSDLNKMTPAQMAKHLGLPG